MNLLEKIIAYKKNEVQERSSRLHEAAFAKSPYFKREVYSLKKFLNDTSCNGIIAEFKRKSPSKGEINMNANVLEVASGYHRYGASGISILTDNFFFGGSEKDLLAVRELEIPILRKEFIIDKYQIAESKAAGADAILLIASCLTKHLVAEFTRIAADIGLEVVLELHDEDELDHVCEGVHVVGINNRNLKTFEVSITKSVAMVARLPREKPIISESGIDSVETIRQLKEVGFNGFLIGEYFMRQEDPVAAFRQFSRHLNDSQIKLKKG